MTARALPFTTSDPCHAGHFGYLSQAKTDSTATKNARSAVAIVPSTSGCFFAHAPRGFSLDGHRRPRLFRNTIERMRPLKARKQARFFLAKISTTPHWVKDHGLGGRAV